MIDKEAIELLLATGRGQQTVNENLGGDPFFINSSGIANGLKAYYPPRRIEQTVTLQDAGSFIEYVNAFKTPNSRIFANLTATAATLLAVLDYHDAPAVPDYCRHRAVFTTLETPEWLAWSKADRTPMDQVQFATWLEDNVHLFVTHPDYPYAPSGAALLELVKSLHGHSNARFNTALRLDNGAFTASLEEDVVIRGTANTTTGAIDLPAVICGGISVYQGSVPYLVAARLKVRVSERKLVLWFETINKPKIIRESILAVVKQVAEATSLVPLLGSLG